MLWPLASNSFAKSKADTEPNSLSPLDTLEDILVTIDFREWSPKKQFYSPKIDIPNNLFKWENLSPNNLEILVVDREEPIKDN